MIPDDNGVPESVPLTRPRSPSSASKSSSDSGLSSSESAFLGLDESSKKHVEFADDQGADSYRDLEDGTNAGPDEPFLGAPKKQGSTRTRRIFWLLGLLCVGGWVLAFILFLAKPNAGGYAASSTSSSSEAAESQASGSTAGDKVNGKPVALDDVLKSRWTPKDHAITWMPEENGEDGMFLEVGEPEGNGYLRLENVRNRGDKSAGKVLMETPFVHANGETFISTKFWPSPDMKKILLLSDYQKNWRHSYTGKYWIFDVETQSAEALDPGDSSTRVQLAHWSPNSDSIVFVRENNMFLRKLASDKVVPVTKDGGKDVFYGAPDWVYEEEVFGDNSVTWWSGDGKYIAFMRTNESAVPEYPVQYFLSRPSGEQPPKGEEHYPEVRHIKYPKAGAPNPTVGLQFYNVEKNEVFSVELPDDFPDDDRIIIEVLWASGAQAILRETNRESDIVKIFLIDAHAKSAKLVRVEDIAGLDGGWVEPARTTRFIPADPENGRPHDGYIDTVIHKGYDHLAYFAPLDNPDPIMLTTGEWEVVDAPSGLDLKHGLVYFIGTKEAPTQRHVYQVKLDGSDLRPLTDTSEIGYYDVSFSSGAGYALISYEGPSVPWQSIIRTQDDSYKEIIEDNPKIQALVDQYALPTKVFQNITVDGYTLQLVERRPPQFDPTKKYPVLFYLYNGPGSQYVNQKFTVDFQAYVASNLGYIVITLDGRGTGYTGRQIRCMTRGNLGHYEARDQIQAAKMWAAKDYVDETRMAIWGWSYGGYMTLKILEQDAGQTFQYGMSVAPVTDWHFYGKPLPFFLSLYPVLKF